MGFDRGQRDKEEGNKGTKEWMVVNRRVGIGGSMRIGRKKHEDREESEDREEEEEERGEKEEEREKKRKAYTKNPGVRFVSAPPDSWVGFLGWIPGLDSWVGFLGS
ncbi:hypothetical protein [Bifidobacterium tissieri]|nr:hypothetical protein [Bifidobacterium tissieri]